MEAEKERGMSIFLDVFRRADKNDSNTLSWDQFRSYFADGVFTDEEMRKLFDEIDTHNTNEIDTGELCTYMSKQLGPFRDIFASIEEMNNSTSNALKKTAEEYPEASREKQFIQRFFLREILNQMSCLTGPLVSASESLERQALEKRGNVSAVAIPADKPTSKTIEVDADNIGAVHPSEIIPGRFARRARRQLSTQTSWTVEGGASGGVMSQQLDRLTSLVDRLENKVNFDGVTDEDIIDHSEEKLHMLVQRKLTAMESQAKAFRNSLRTYVEAVNRAEGYLHINVRNYAGTNVFIIYEIWESEDDWKSFVASDASKSFRHSSIDNLEIPEVCSTMKIPATWWNRG